ncbi:AMP-binding protein [Candidatus Bipolaricaulota bacterium]|nr:AMP-binding protein [Candidatus Bipolaricaulota bacterium]
MRGPYPTLNELFERTIHRFPDRIAIRNTTTYMGEPSEISYAELESEVSRLAAALAARGVEIGDRVAILSPPRIRFATVALATMRCGAWFVPLDPTLAAPEAQTLLNHCQPMLVFAPGSSRDHLPADLAIVDLDDDPTAGSTYTSLLREGAAAPGGTIASQQDVLSDAIAVLAYTSGTTGDPKGVMLSHGNIAADLIEGTKAIPVAPSDVILFVAPWHHIMGLTTGLFLPLFAGATAMHTSDFRRIAELMKAHRVTIFAAVPKLYHAMFEKLMAKVTGSAIGRTLWRVAPRLVGRQVKRNVTGQDLRFFVSGSAPLSAEVAQGFRRMGIGMMEGYGLTETSPVVCLTDPYRGLPGSVGVAIPSVETRVVDPRPDGVGELHVRGPIVMAGYYRNEEATGRVVDSDGWFHTGDLATVDQKGNIFLKGRAKNVIVLDSGKNIYPEELEWQIGRVPYVEEVLVRAALHQGRIALQAVIFPNRQRMQDEGIEDSDHERLLDRLWAAIRERQKQLAPYKRLRSRSQLLLTNHPFPKTGSLDIKRHLLERERHDRLSPSRG